MTRNFRLILLPTLCQTFFSLENACDTSAFSFTFFYKFLFERFPISPFLELQSMQMKWSLKRDEVTQKQQTLFNFHTWFQKKNTKTFSCSQPFFLCKVEFEWPSTVCVITDRFLNHFKSVFFRIFHSWFSPYSILSPFNSRQMFSGKFWCRQISSAMLVYCAVARRWMSSAAESFDEGRRTVLFDEL